MIKSKLSLARLVPKHNGNWQSSKCFRKHHDAGALFVCNRGTWNSFPTHGEMLLPKCEHCLLCSELPGCINTGCIFFYIMPFIWRMATIATIYHAWTFMIKLPYVSNGHQSLYGEDQSCWEVLLPCYFSFWIIPSRLSQEPSLNSTLISANCRIQTLPWLFWLTIDAKSLFS